jgi:hypothetical protein
VAVGLLVLPRLKWVGPARLGGEELVAEDEDVVLVSSSHRSASMGRREMRANRYPATETPAAIARLREAETARRGKASD